MRLGVLPSFMSVNHVCAQCLKGLGHPIPWNRSYRWSRAAIWVLGIEPWEHSVDLCSSIFQMLSPGYWGVWGWPPISILSVWGCWKRIMWLWSRLDFWLGRSGGCLIFPMLMRKDLWEEAASLLSTLRTYVEIFSTQMRKKNLTC